MSRTHCLQTAPLLRNGLCTAALLFITAAFAVAQDSDRKAPSTDTDAKLRKLVVGVWRDHYQGKRAMTVNEDGTATMVVELTGVTGALYAKRLEFDMVWSVEGGHLKKRTTGGKPSGRVKAILKMMGDRVDELILELDDKHLLLLDGDGKKKYDWKKVVSNGPADSAP